MTVKCPKCGGSEIREKNVAYADLPVVTWNLDDSGHPVPDGYDTDVAADWETVDCDKQYVCYQLHREPGAKWCDWEGYLSELIVEIDR